MGEHEPWDEFVDDLSDAISDSMDCGWGANDGARAVVRWLNENALSGTRAAAVKAERDDLLEALKGLVGVLGADEIDREAVVPSYRAARAAIRRAQGEFLS